MYSIWHIPELVVHITLFLDEHDLAQCYYISRTWRNILKANIPPQRLPLPDLPGLNNVDRLNRDFGLPHDLREYATRVQEYEIEQKSAEFGSSLFFWRDSAYWSLLQMVRPYLHPWLAKYSSQLCGGDSGLRSMSEGKLDIRIQTTCTFEEFEELLDSEGGDRSALLTQSSTSSVDVFCVKGAEWNSEYNLNRDWDRKFRIRIEREKGVRLIDIVDEIRGCLLHADGSEDERLVLEWHFNAPNWALNQNLSYMAGML